MGLKPTWGRDCAEGCPNLVKTLVSTGPIASCVADALLMYAITANAGESIWRLAFLLVTGCTVLCCATAEMQGRAVALQCPVCLASVPEQGLAHLLACFILPH